MYSISISLPLVRRLLVWVGLSAAAGGVPAQAPADSSASVPNFPKGMYWEGGLHIGRIIKHTGSIVMQLPPLSIGGEISWEVKAYGQKDWHAYCGYPRMGVALSYQNFDDPKRLGHGIGILPHLTVDFYKSRNRRWRIFGRLGLGVSVVTRPFHARTNPENNIIGSYLNNNTQLRLGAAVQIHPEWELRPSVSFTHYSNGASQFPNRGINVLSFHLGVCHLPNPISPQDIRRPDSLPPKLRSRRPQFACFAGLGYRESIALGGPKYPVLMGSVDVGFYLARNNRLKLGAEYEWIGSVHAFQKQLGIYAPEQIAWKASRVAIFIEDEVILGHLGLLGRVGFYATRNPQQPLFFFTRVALRYYVFNPLTNERRVNPFVGIALKAHEITAEYFSLQLGATF